MENLAENCIKSEFNLHQQSTWTSPWFKAVLKQREVQHELACSHRSCAVDMSPQIKRVGLKGTWQSNTLLSFTRNVSSGICRIIQWQHSCVSAPRRVERVQPPWHKLVQSWEVKCCTFLLWLSESLQSTINNSKPFDWLEWPDVNYKYELYKEYNCLHKTYIEILKRT